jgi:mono/diheme cytochrome c family protein
MLGPWLEPTVGSMRRWLIRGAIVFAAVGVAAQFVPYGRDHANPAVGSEPAWDSAATRSLALRACFDCHSNLTTWPWYSRIAPASWLVYADVVGGREHLNFSAWDRSQEADVEEIVGVVRDGSMPPLQYKLMHAGSRLTKAERSRLVSGLERTLASSPPGY